MPAGDGQGCLAGRPLRPGGQEVCRGRRVPRRGRQDPAPSEVVELAKGIEGLKRWGVHAAGVIMSSEPPHRCHPDHAPAAGRPGHHPVRTTPAVSPRPGQDGLRPGNLTILDDALREREGQPRPGDRPGRPVQGHDRQGDHPVAGARRHPRVFQLDGGGMRRCCGSCSRTTSRTSGRPRPYRPTPMGVNAHTNFAPRKNGKAGSPSASTRNRGVATGRWWRRTDPEMTHGLVIYQSR